MILVIEIKDISFSYKKGKNILNNININIEDGEVVAIVGDNGAGKSTLGRIIAGIIKPQKGNIIIDNVDIRKNEISKKNVGIVFQNPENQIIFNNIYDEIMFSLKDLSKEEIKTRIEQALEKVEMLEYINQDLYELSLGQKQRIVIAEVLARKPKYIIFDEPTTMIDSEGKDKIYKIIKELKKEGYTIIYITNLAEEILLADRILILENGTITDEIKKEELIEKAETLSKHNIKIPMIVEVARRLNILNLKDYTIEELVKAIQGVKQMKDFFTFIIF